MSDYYKHIDGLRGLAVFSILLFHLGFSYFSGGFVGVDIFFVISGFLITNILMRELETTGRLNFLNFYTRRIKRILPALSVTLLLSFIAAILLLNTAKFIEFGGSLSSAALSVSNIFFKKQFGYFDVFSQSNPLLHTWSLGVEEQFYIFYPILLFIVFMLLKKRWVTLIATIIAISFILNLLNQNKNLTALYYLVQYRAFEFCIGAFLVWLITYKITNNYILELLCLFGFGLIIYSIFTFNSNTLFPSYNALIPTIGVAFIIYAGSSKYIGYLFRNSAARWLGLISYSLYLIHWPMIVFTETYNEDIGLPFNIDIKTKIILLILTIIIASVMYFLIEQPFRKTLLERKSLQIKFAIKWLAIILLITGFGASTFYSKGWLWRAQTPDLAKTIPDITKYHVKNWGGAGFSGGYIYQGKTVYPSIVILGDSHAGMLDTGMIQEIAVPLHLTIFTASGGGAGKYASSLLLPGLTKIGPDQTTYDDSAKSGYKEALHEFKKSTTSIFIFSASYSSQLNTAGYLTTHQSLNIHPENMVTYNDYQPFIQALNKLESLVGDGRLIIIGDVPGSTYIPINCIGKLKWFHTNNCPAQDRENLNRGAVNINKILSEYAAIHHVYFINPYDTFCKHGFCSSVDQNGIPYYSDGTHLSKTGSIFLMENIKNKIMDVLRER